jgi:4-amino-4-deoxy-L-arabinose transferase-like glycosyltransferase
LAAALFLLNDVVLFEMRAAYVDLALAFFALAAFLCLERWLDKPSARRYLIAAGLACGLLAATKINGIATAACLAVLMLPRLFSGLRSNRRAAASWALAFGLPFAALWLPWLLRTWTLTGNPVYPLLYDRFGGPDWSSQLGEQFLHWQHAIGMGRQPLDWLLLPWRVLTAGGLEYEHFGGRLTPLWLVFLPLALWQARRPGRARRCLVVVGLLFVTWALGSQQMRFLIPALPLVALAVTDGAAGVLARRPWRALADSPALPWIAVVLWLAAFAGTQNRLAAAGWSHLRLYTTTGFEMPPSAPSPPVFHAIAELPATATVLLLNTNHLYYCRPTTCWADSFFEASQISDWLGHADGSEAVTKLLRERGVSHVAWSGKPRGIAYPPAVMGWLGNPAAAQVVFAEGPDRLWRLDPEATSDAP